MSQGEWSPQSICVSLNYPKIGYTFSAQAYCGIFCFRVPVPSLKQLNELS